MRPFFRWYDFWVGAYYDRARKVLYICPLPMIGVEIELWRVCDNCGVGRNRHAPYCYKARPTYEEPRG